MPANLKIFVDRRYNLLKIIYPVCCGIEVHKKFVVACIASTNERGITTYIISPAASQTFANGLKKLFRVAYLPNSLNRCLKWSLPVSTG